MKKIGILLLTLLLLTACASGEQTQASGDFLYYFPAKTVINGEEGAFCSMQTELTGEQTDLEAFLKDYLEAQPPENGEPPVPEQWKLRSVDRQEQTAVLAFSGTGVSQPRQTLSCACLARTLLQISDIQRVSIQVPGRGEPVVLTEGDILLEDSGMLPQKETVVLYFPDEKGRYLVGQTVTAEAMDNEEKPEFIMQQLLSSENSGQIRSAIPQGTKLLGIQVNNGVCTVNLSAAFQQEGQTFAQERLAVYSIVDSLTELPEIRQVDFLVSGTPVETLNRMDLSSGVLRDETVIALSGENLVDVTLYPLCDSQGLLVPVPVMLEPAEGQSVAEAAANALLSYESRNGMEGCIPVGTKLLQLRMENGTCILELTGEFLTGCPTAKEETSAVRSVIATMCALPGISSVEILVEGLAPRYRSSELSNLHQTNPAWLTE